MKAIQTYFRGYKFRSRTEARWAVFFEALGIRWVYEPEGFVLPNNVPYLPDFHLPELGLWIEIKPGIKDEDGFFAWPEHPVFDAADVLDPYEEGNERTDFARFVDGFVLIAGSPYVDADGRAEYEGFVLGDNGRLWCECPTCGKLGIQYEARYERLCDCVPSDKGHRPLSPRLEAAYHAARSARFEHGESPRLP